MAYVTSAGKPYKSFSDAVKIARAKPDSVTYGSVGSGSLGHLTTTLLQQAGNFSLVHVPFKGGGPMSVALYSGGRYPGSAPPPARLSPGRLAEA